ncbi:helix-turn-helix transcriptional regulator [Leptospira jelokensis]|uniref:AraC family transcriptional regulator n=1 Tax=Leptospira jelokensis TaxID=2484931 RepID=A0A4Z1A592_9LEPT|nr:helix-turn-helix transcriptional regulator [Leptospira jelokensis]TGL65101.1 AraC family transcriptional regulator [Leptospira jelokensis]
MSIFWIHPSFVLQYEKRNLQYGTHSHHAVQILFSPNESFKITSNHIFEIHKQLIVIPHNSIHKFSIKNPYLSIYLDPKSIVANKILNYAAARIDFNLKLSKFLKFYKDISSKQISPKNIPKRLEEVLLDLLNESNSQNCFGTNKNIMDERVSICLDLIERYSYQGEPIKPSQLAKSCNLSMFRLVHLFSENVGIPIRTYALWCKMRNAISFLMSKESMLDSSYLAYFSDQSHFSRSFKRMFGINPSEIFQDPSKFETFFIL